VEGYGYIAIPYSVMCYNAHGRQMRLDSNDKPAEEKRDRLRNKIIPLLALLLVIAIMVGIFYFYRHYPEMVSRLEDYGYLGAFLISLTLNATVVLPAGNILVLAVLGATLPSATLVGLAGAAGAAVGEITGYMVGYSGQAMVQRQRTYIRVEGWVKKWGAMTIFLVSIVPFFFDLAGIAAGVLRFPLWKFLLACWLGRTILYIVIALAGAQGWEVILHYFA
jgi:membrane protein DedA with SNARE-associated domain